MGTTADKINYLNGTKAAIKEAIENKGVTVSDSDTFRSYAEKIGDISGGSEEPVAYVSSTVEDIPTNTNLASLLKGITITKWPYLTSIKEKLTNNFFDVHDALGNTFIPQEINLPKEKLSSNVQPDRFFTGCRGVTDIQINNFESMEDIVDWSYAFSGSYLPNNAADPFGSTPIQGFEVGNKIRLTNAENLNYMFQNCSNFKVYSFYDNPAPKVKTMVGLFNNCANLTVVVFTTNGITSTQVTDISQMFYGCASLTRVDFSGLDTSSLSFWSDSTFGNCNQLSEITWGENWLSSGLISLFTISNIYINHDSCLDLFNKIANAPDMYGTIELSSTTKGYMSEEEIAIATGKGWTVA